MKGLFWFGIVLLVLVMVYSGFSASCYAPPRDENTIPPYVEDIDSNVAQASQTEVFKDASGWLNQREHPLRDFFQANAFSGTNMGTFSSLESSAGNAVMTVIPYDEQYSYGGTVSQTVAGTTNCRSSVAVVKPTDTASYVCPVATTGECILGPGTYTIDSKSYSMDVYPPLYVTATAPSGITENMAYKGDGCQPPQRLTLDARRGFNTLVLSLTGPAPTGTGTPIA